MTGPRVLLVDDDRRFAEVVRSLLTDDGYQVVGVVGTVAETLTAVAAADPDVVVLDILLPDGDGLDAVDALRSHGQEAPVVLFSSLFDQRIARATMAEGCGYVEKAGGLEALELAIDAAIDLRDA